MLLRLNIIILKKCNTISFKSKFNWIFLNFGIGKYYIDRIINKGLAK